MVKGMRFRDHSRIPEWVVTEAKRQLEFELSPEQYEELVNTDYESDLLVETWHGDFRRYRLSSNEWDNNAKGYVQDLMDMRDKIIETLRGAMSLLGQCRVYAVYNVECVKRSFKLRPLEAEGGEVVETEVQELRTFHIRSSDDDGHMEIMRKSADIPEVADNLIRAIIRFMEIFEGKDSGWAYHRSLDVELFVSKQKVGRFDPKGHAAVEESALGGTWCPLPPWLENKRVFNPKPPHRHRDKRCFAWSILRAKYARTKGAKSGECKDLKSHLDEVILPKGVSYPIPIKDSVLRKVEDANEFSFSIVSLGKTVKKTLPLYVSKHRGKKAFHVVLGLLEGQHLVLIRDLGRVLRNGRKDRSWFCENCFSAFKSEDRCNRHMEECIGMEPTRVRMPEEGGAHHKIEFKSWQYRMEVPFVVYADIEAILKPVGKTGAEDALAVHKPVAWAYKIACRDKRFEAYEGARGLPLGEMRSYCGKKSMHELLDHLAEDAEFIESLVNMNVPYQEGPGDAKAFAEATKCHICRREGFGMGAELKVLDHDHLTGRYRGAAHMSCNAMYSSHINWKLPVYFHNLTGYDSFHIIRGLKDYTDSIEDIKPIARSLDKFTSFSIDNLRFIDSHSFIQGSLDAMAQQLLKSCKDTNERVDKFQGIMEVFGIEDPSDERFEMLLQKGVYPYEHMSSMDALDDTQLPPRDAFWSDLKKECATEQEYLRATAMWEAFNCQTMEDYTMLYVKLDVMLLATLFELFRDACLPEDSFGLDPAHFITAPSLSWSAMLWMNYQNQVVIENMTDINMLLMVKKGIRGGMTQVFKPFARMKEGVSIFYWDANNLYGKAMSGPLPQGDYRWEYVEAEWVPETDGVLLQEGEGEMTPNVPAEWVCDWTNVEEVKTFIGRATDEDARGYILEVDLDVPDHLHDYFADYPLCPDAKQCTPSPHTVKQYAAVGIQMRDDGTSGMGKKLVNDLMPKRKYVVHYLVLQQYLRLGMKLVKVYRAFSFHQSTWLKSYIDFNTEKRRLAKLLGDFAGVILYKLLINSIYGKFAENVWKRRNVSLLVGAAYERALNMASSPHMKMWKVILPDELLVMEMAKHRITLNRPMVIGFSVLEMSKRWMFGFHYDHVKPFMGENAKLLYTDTDSLVYKMKWNQVADSKEDFVRKFQDQTRMLDLSETLPKFKHHYEGQVPMEAGILGKFKDECFGEDILEWVGLRPKMYSYLRGDGQHFKKMKGVAKSATVTMTEEERDEYFQKRKATGIFKEDEFRSKRRKLEHKDFVEVLHCTPGSQRGVEFTVLRAARGRMKVNDDTGAWVMQTLRVQKRGLSNTDDKMYYLDALHSLPYGHWRIKEIELRAKEKKEAKGKEKEKF